MDSIVHMEEDRSVECAESADMVSQAAETEEASNPALLHLIVESWRFCRVFETALSQMEEAARRKFESRLRWYEKQLASVLDQSGWYFIDFTGEMYEAGLPLTPLNLSAFEENEFLLVDYMVEPVIGKQDGIARYGTAMLRRGE